MASRNGKTQLAPSSTSNSSTAKNDSSRPPSYYYSIESMAHSRVRQFFSPEGTWLPPKGLRGNQRPRQNGDLMLFHFNGEMSTFVTGLPQSEEAIERLNVYKCCSIYYDEGSFWSVGLNAIHNRVGNGQRTNAAADAADEDSDAASQLSSSDDDDADDEWRHLTFNERLNQVSSACRRGSRRRLITRRVDQVWADRLFPDRYQTHHITNRQNEGGLVGELPLLIGLMAFTMPSTFVSQGLPVLIRRSWVISQAMDRNIGWRDKRGMVVTIYYDPQAGPAQGTTPSTLATLQALEEGGYGNLLP